MVWIMLGMPIGLRSMIHQENQPEWYKQMYNSLHQKHRRHNDFNNRVARNESKIAKMMFLLKLTFFKMFEKFYRIAEYILNTLL